MKSRVNFNNILLKHVTDVTLKAFNILQFHLLIIPHSKLKKKKKKRISITSGDRGVDPMHLGRSSPEFPSFSVSRS